MDKLELYSIFKSSANGQCGRLHACAKMPRTHLENNRRPRCCSCNLCRVCTPPPHWDRRAIQPNRIKFRTCSALAALRRCELPPINESAELARGTLYLIQYSEYCPLYVMKFQNQGFIFCYLILHFCNNYFSNIAYYFLPVNQNQSSENGTTLDGSQGKV